MDTEHFEAGIRHLETMFGSTLGGQRKQAYRAALCNIPDELWDEGIICIARTARFFPSVAEIGEVCVPGESEREEKDPWTGRWAKVLIPWPERLARLLRPALPAPEKMQPDEPIQPQVTKEHWQRLRDTISLIMSNPGIAQAVLAKAPDENAVRTAHAQLEHSDKKTYESLSLEDKVRWQIRKRGGPRPLQRKWTQGQMEERRIFLDQQWNWLKRRDLAERAGEAFADPQPIWETQTEEEKAA